MAKTNYDTPGLIEAAKNGDPEAQDELVARNLGLLRSMAGRIVGFNRADGFIEFAKWGYLKSLETFDPSFGVKFSTYAAQGAFLKVAQEAAHRLPDTKKRVNTCQLELDMDFVDLQAPIEGYDVERLHQRINMLPDRLRYIVNARLSGATWEKIAAMIGITYQRVDQLEKKAHQWLRENWESKFPKAKVA